MVGRMAVLLGLSMLRRYQALASTIKGQARPSWKMPMVTVASGIELNEGVIFQILSFMKK